MIASFVVAALIWTGVSARQWSTNTTSPTITLTVNTSSVHQTIAGLGFCEAFQRANAVFNAPDNVRRDVLDLLFDTETGAGLSILRLGLGSSLDSSHDYMDSIQPVAGPYTWDHNASSQVWLAKEARTYGVPTFYADAWSAPGWMKTNGRDGGGGYLLKDRVGDYVAYLTEYVRLWTSEGIPLSHIGFVNEPNVVKEYATMGLGNKTTNASVAGAQDIVPPLYASLANLSAATNTSVGISCCEAQGWSMAGELLTEVDDSQLAVVTTHAYKGDPAAPDVPLNTTRPVWITENSPIMHRLGFSEIWHFNGSENEGLVWANLLHGAFVDGNVSAYLYWIGAGPFGQEVPLVWVTNSTEAGYRVAATYWAMAHWGRFVRPGARRVGVDVGERSEERKTNERSEDKKRSERSEDVKVTAYVNGRASVVVQAINNGDGNTTVSLVVPDAQPRQFRSITAWLTDGGRHLQKVGTFSPGRGQPLEAVLPPRSLTTFDVRYRWRRE